MFLCCNRIADNKFCKYWTLFCRRRRKVVYGYSLYSFIFEYLDCNKLMPKITYLETLNSPYYGNLEIRAMINSPSISLIPKKQERENKKFISLIPMRSNLFQTPRVEELGFDFNTFFKVNNWILYAPSRLPKTTIILSLDFDDVILNLNLRNLYVIEHDTRNCIILAAQG